MATGDFIRESYLKFYRNLGHVIIPSAPLVPENDPTTLFTGSGMQPMISYLLGETHPMGTRLVDSQKCFRAQDIEEVGDNRHDTFFEMLGNWSLGDYFKEEQIAWLYEYLTSIIGLDKNRLSVSVFAGDEIIPKDSEAERIWIKVGIPKNKINFYDEKKNWWSRAGIKANMPVGEPGGPDSEVFYDFGENLKLHDNSPYKSQVCHPNCDCGRFLEIGNSVFMTYQKTAAGFTPLAKKNIDFGGGLERLASAVGNDPDQFKTDLYSRIVSSVEDITGKKYSDNLVSLRIIADHFKASVFLIADGVFPSNKSQGYFLRRLLRRSLVKLSLLGVDQTEFGHIVSSVYETYSAAGYLANTPEDYINKIITEEADKFAKTLKLGLKKIGSVSPFDLFQTYGFPPEITEEIYRDRGLNFDKNQFEADLKSHQNLSRTASKGMFKGGLQDHSEITTRYHTATHLLHKALRVVLGDHVSQKGSNITAERLRFDFSHPAKLTPGEIARVENLINEKIEENLPVKRTEMSKKDALAQGALAFFPEKYPEVTSVYTIGDKDHWFSRELCGGPHVSSTSAIGRIKIIKEESAGSGIRRIYATALH